MCIPEASPSRVHWLGREGRTSLAPGFLRRFPQTPLGECRLGRKTHTAKVFRASTVWPRAPRQSSSVTRWDLDSQTHRSCMVSAFAQRSHPLDLPPQSAWGLAGRGCVLPVVCRGPFRLTPVTLKSSRVEGVCLQASCQPLTSCKLGAHLRSGK